jgi:hypothetical protein
VYSKLRQLPVNNIKEKHNAEAGYAIATTGKATQKRNTCKLCMDFASGAIRGSASETRTSNVFEQSKLRGEVFWRPRNFVLDKTLFSSFVVRKVS